MKQRVKDLLIDRLSTPDLKLATGVLRDLSGCMCSLGHIADLYIAETDSLEWPEFEDGSRRITMFPGSGTDILPIEIHLWAGIGTDDELEIFRKNDTRASRGVYTSPAEMVEFIRNEIDLTDER